MLNRSKTISTIPGKRDSIRSLPNQTRGDVDTIERAFTPRESAAAAPCQPKLVDPIDVLRAGED